MEFLTVRSLATLLDLSEQTAYKLLREGVIPGRVKVGKSVRFNKEAVEVFEEGKIKIHYNLSPSLSS